MQPLSSIVDRALGLLGIKVVRRESFSAMQRNALVGFHKLFWILRVSPYWSTFTDGQVRDVLSKARSQLGQDVLALSFVGTQRPGFFVEFGATNGESLSNTFLLEKHFGWTGILCEPARTWLPELRKNRTAKIDTRCVYSNSEMKVSFLETQIAELSTIQGFGADDEHSVTRESNSSYEVKTVTLLDLLDFHKAPKHVDFLSVDTEGSEFEILNAFDFSKYSFGTICVEHNYMENRSKVRGLLEANGYRQVYPELSDFDDWFVLETNQSIPS